MKKWNLNTIVLHEGRITDLKEYEDMPLSESKNLYENLSLLNGDLENSDENWDAIEGIDIAIPRKKSQN